MRKLLILLMLISVQFYLSAQQRNHMPYSIYGLGNIYPKGFTHNMAMGRTGIALSSPRYLNNINPASYHTIDSVSFFFDFGLSGDFVKYETSRYGTQHGMDMNIKNVAMGFRISPNLSSSIGIAPYSSVGYKIQTTKPISGTLDNVFNVEISGNGGLNQFYWNNSYKLLNHLSLGVNFTYLFGNIESSEKVIAQNLTDIILKQSSYLSKLYADFGFQFFFPVNKDIDVTLGGIYGNSHRINIKDQFIITDSEGNISQDEVTQSGHFKFPYHAGGGFAVTYKKSLTLTADYLYYDWSNTPSSSNSNFKYSSNNLFRFGVEMIPGRYSQLGYFGGVAYRAGLYHEESYLEINGHKFSDNGFTFGLGLPFLQNRTSINISYNYGTNGTLQNNLIKENYHSFMFSLTLHDWWFIQRKID